MREYSQKEVLWLDSLPSEWQIKPLFTLGFENKKLNRNLSEQNLLSLSYGKVVEKDIKSDDGLLPASFEGYQVVEPGILIFRFTDLQNDQTSLRSGLVTSRGIITNAYLGFVPTGVSPRFLDYLMRALDTNKVFYGMGSGLRQSLTWDDARRIPVLLPDAAEQQAIVYYLDQETSQIDLLISKKEQLIEKLIERRQALITQAVTKGLDAGCPTRFSGIEWLPESPAHWTKSRLRYVVTFSNKKYNADLPLLSVYLHRGVILHSDGGGSVHAPSLDLSSYQGVSIGDFVLNNQQAWRGSVGVSFLDGNVSPAYVVCSFGGALDIRFANFLMRSDAVVKQLELASRGVGDIQRQLHGPSLKNVVLNFPSIKEQQAIAAFLERAAGRIERLIGKAKESVEVLKQRRQALITQVVTGKLDVRGFAGANS